LNDDLVAVKGQWLSVIWASDSVGNAPAREIYLSLNDKEKARVMELFRRLAETGRISNREQFKSLGKEGGDLWEFKKFQIRFLGDFRPGKKFVVAQGIVDKKRDHLRPTDIDRARRILAEHDEREKREQ
jgi:hypothetical protein